MELYFVYILKCADDSYYIGHTNDVERRLLDHKAGAYTGYTSVRLPVRLIYFKDFACRDEAFTFERQIKKWSRKKKEALINGDLQALKMYSKKKPK
jgi:predicted GIY-YIG superfamily endonuclease